MERKQLLPLLCVGMLSLTACSNRDTAEHHDKHSRDSITGDIVSPDLGGYKDGLPSTGTIDGIGGVDGIDGFSGTGYMEGLSQVDGDYMLSPLGYPLDSTTSVATEDVASWDLMIDHGHYHATNQGKVYPYGDAGFYGEDFHKKGLWDHAKDTMEDSIHEAERGIQDLGKDVEHGLEDLMKDVDSGGKAKAEK